MNTRSACSCGLAHWAKLLRLHLVEVVLQCSCVAWWIVLALTFSHIRWSPFSFLFSRVLSPYLLMEAHCRTRYTCGCSGLLLVLRPVGGEQCPPPFHPASAAGCADPDVSAYQRYNKESGVYLQSPNLLTIAASATVGMWCELMKLCFFGWDEA